jgi:hypothetical protein
VLCSSLGGSACSRLQFCPIINKCFGCHLCAQLCTYAVMQHHRHTTVQRTTFSHAVSFISCPSLSSIGYGGNASSARILVRNLSVVHIYWTTSGVFHLLPPSCGAHPLNHEERCLVSEERVHWHLATILLWARWVVYYSLRFKI